MSGRKLGGALIELIKRFKPLFCLILESSELFAPDQRNASDGTVPLLGDDDFRFPGDRLLLLATPIVLFTMNEHHDVRILLDRTRFAQMTQLGNVILSIFGLPVQLRETKYGSRQFASESLQAASDASDLFLARIAGIVGFDELQIIDYDQAKFALAATNSTSCSGDLRNHARW